eukprot:CAMPEP_0175056996 /NCGR_PEP_ID=MMETSP0052_2-20121109/11005_1 /TAXON_ID=51329 ORGANISM="Polytomella parva, Strain SAG 63-3" /NCGR_SAMPLE_ID=MMETSP0052_2 /ASSEMBLY_ACC=CAM_ASM_000194 /LENGTH=97 /DNA_ID=CAMNT_0016322133 /DNA_START=950 /DNA_END=1240 /DNA_ORIENTATION=-
MIARIKVKDKVRRGGVINGTVQERVDNQPLPYTEVRGLQFCPEKKKFVSMDKVGTGTIARLAVMQIYGWARPSAWCHPQQRSSVSKETQIHSATMVD